VFVGQETGIVTAKSLIRTLVPGGFEADLSYFTACFLPMNLFSGQFLLGENDLQAALHVSPALGHAISSISLLHRSSMFQDGCLIRYNRQDLQKAMESYSQSVRLIQCLIWSNKFESEPHALWSTFLLGLFEVCDQRNPSAKDLLTGQLMRDTTGRNWLVHFLSGTCTILRLQHPSSLLFQDENNVRRRKFFLATRIFEISRSLIFTQPTFLADSNWVNALTLLWAVDGVGLWHPKEAMFDMLPKFSELSIRAIRFCHTEAAQLPRIQQIERANSLAIEGLLLQTMLREWREIAMQWLDAKPDISTRPDVDLLIAQVYFHAINIYLSGIFDYHEPWTEEGAPCAPILTRDEVEYHLAEIFLLSRKLLAAGVAGIMLFFPLRVAGARSRRFQDQDLIISFFRQISQRGYTTATTLVSELGALWGVTGWPS